MNRASAEHDPEPPSSSNPPSAHAPLSPVTTGTLGGGCDGPGPCPCGGDDNGGGGGGGRGANGSR